MSCNETLQLIKKRFLHERSIYTWCGIALVAVNPYLNQDIYGDEVITTYHSASHSAYQLDPHVFAITENAHSMLDINGRDQSIIVSGESGAGKTVSAKHAMRYLASISGGSKIRIEHRVLASNPIMEAIGNASTMRNDNSSRFGKYIKIYFERHGRRILGANMRTYLLEKSRVTIQQSGERNYHIFYQLLSYSHKNPHKTSHLCLLDANNSMRQFNILGGLEPQDSRDDLRKFNEALQTLNVDEARVDVIYRIVAGILHGGNIRFLRKNPDDDESSCTVDMDEFHFKACCELLGLDPEITRKRLTVKLLRSGARDVIEQPLSVEKAEYTRDAMLKYIYECLFTWLVALINLSLSCKTPNGELGGPVDELLAAVTPTKLQANPLRGGGLAPTPLKSPTAKKSILDGQQHQEQEPQFIGVLDIYGFENFKSNSFEQFCINYANEVLQQQYNQHVFKIEQEEYIREGIDWTFIEYSDNQPVIDIIESRPIGILNLLDEECRMPRGTDQSWCAKLYDHLLPVGKEAQETARFRRPKMNYRNSFTICHYAEDVNYDVATFLEKNRDSIAEEQCKMLRASDVLSYIFEDQLLRDAPASARPKIRTSRSATVGYQFRGSLAALIRTLNATEPHYIRCIKPNDEKKAFEFDEERAVQQLKACGVYETIRISNNGFPSRWHYKDFAKRYCILIYRTAAFKDLAGQSVARRCRQAREQQVAEEQEEEEEEQRTASTAEDTFSTEDTTDESPQQSERGSPAPDGEQPGLAPPTGHFMCQFTSADIRPICEAICKCAYGETSRYEHLRTEEEQAYIGQLRERHGDKPGAIYQFGKTKIFFRAGQVAYLERARNQLLRDYSVTIQRHVRGWLARRSFLVRRELYLEQVRREASLLSLQQQVSSLQTELDQVKEEAKEEQQQQQQLVREDVNRLGSMYSLLIDIMFGSIQPLIISAVLEYEALDPPGEPFSSLDSSSRSLTPDGGEASDRRSGKHSMDNLIRELDKFYDLIRKNGVPEDISVQAFKQIFYLICAHSLNQLLIRRDLCQFRKAMQINFNLSCLVQWCREHYIVKWRDIVEQLDPITQATKLLQTRKSSEDITTIEEVCNKLRPSQIIKMLNMYTSTYEEQITFEFIHALEGYLNKTRASKHQAALRQREFAAAATESALQRADVDAADDDSGQFDANNNGANGVNNDLLMDTKHYFAFVDLVEA